MKHTIGFANMPEVAWTMLDRLTADLKFATRFGRYHEVYPRGGADLVGLTRIDMFWNHVARSHVEKVQHFDARAADMRLNGVKNHLHHPTFRFDASLLLDWHIQHMAVTAREHISI